MSENMEGKRKSKNESAQMTAQFVYYHVLFCVLLFCFFFVRGDVQFVCVVSLLVVQSLPTATYHQKKTQNKHSFLTPSSFTWSKNETC